jgi:uncharacterized cupredoxin-like copper-binding protein
MRPARLVTIVFTLSLGVALIAGCSSSSSSKSSKKSSGGGVTVSSEAPGTPVAVTVSDTKGLDAPETLVPSVVSVVPGNVTFTVKNTGTIDHEMLVIKTDTPFDQLPIVDAGDPPATVTTGADKIAETGNVGETGDPNLKPNTTRVFTIKNLAAGNYVLACNIAKHYGLGMRAAFTVK